MRIAIVHDWLITYAGAERVLEQMLLCYSQADLFSIVDFLPAGQRSFLNNKTVSTSFIQKLPFAKSKYRQYLPLMPLAVEQFDLSNYDLIISSSHAVAKGVLTGPDQMHICMCYSPIRYSWDLQHQYLKESFLNKGIKSWFARWMLHRIRLWDHRTSNGVDSFISISEFIKKRIWKVYRRESTVIYPPVDISYYNLSENKEDCYLTVSRMVPYKRIDMIAEAFAQMPEKKLVIIGDGPDYKKIVSKAGKNIVFLGFQSGEVLRAYMQRSRAFIYAAEEDFGITPLEAQACGTPVIAFGKGGALETIKGIWDKPEYSKQKVDDGLSGSEFDKGLPTGVFFKEQNVKSLISAVNFFESNQEKFLPVECRKNAERFSPNRFKSQFKNFVDQHLKKLRTEPILY